MNETIRLKNPSEKAVEQIQNIEQEVSVMGSNDSEIPDLNGLISGLKEGKLSPENAVKEAMKIRDRKQDYH